MKPKLSTLSPEELLMKYDSRRECHVKYNEKIKIEILNRMTLGDILLALPAGSKVLINKLCK